MRFAAGVASVALALIAVLHVIWIFSPWPLNSRADFARLVVGVPGDRLPSAPMTASIAVLLAAAAYIVPARAGLIPQIGSAWVYAAGSFTVAAVLLLRGLGGLVMSGVRPGAFKDFNNLDLKLYSPLCLTLGGLALWVAVAAF